MPIGVNTLAEPLANELARRKVLPAPQAVDIVRQLAHGIAQRHESGRLHLHIAADLVSYDPASARAELREPLEESRSFGGSDGDDEFCPPELQQPRSVLLPVQLAVARDVLRASGLSAVDPRRVDLYQLAVLLCRLLTGESVSAFLSRPRVAAKVPVEVRDLIERALGHDPQRALRSAPELLRGLESLDAAVTVALPSAQPGSTRNVTEPDTTPSFVGVGKADTDAGRPAPSPMNDDALPFQKLGHYEIVGRLGRGGMGDVYKGYERRLDRHVAIKVLPQEFSRQDEMVKRFNAEASAAAKLVHPNTVEIFFIGEDSAAAVEGQTPSTVHFFAMQFVEGESLAELLSRRQRLNVDEALAITEQVLAGLGAAHQLGMVHRDIKPGNILIDRQRQRVQLADFGLVKSLQGSGMTASGVIVGTADYMAPEQGRGGTVDARADLYAIGVVLYQMLSGRLPFRADSVTAMIFQHVYETPPPLNEVASDVPETLAAIVAKLMAKSADARYQNVAELLADFRAFHQGHPLPRRPSEAAVAELAGASDRPRSVIITAPRFADEAVLPATLTQIVAPRGWQRLRQAMRDFVLMQREEFVQQLQTTETQVDGAIAEYERRHGSLLDAIGDAEGVAHELETQRDIWRRANAEAEQRAATANDDEIARTALGEKVRGERVLADVSQQCESQQVQLAEMQRKLSQVTATLERLRSQRDVLNARLKVARAQIRFAGGEVKTRHGWRWVFAVRWGNVGLLALVLGVLVAAAATIADTELHGLLVRGDPSLSDQSPIQVAVEEKLGQASTLAELYVDPPNPFGLPFSGCDKRILDLAVSPTGNYVAAATGDPTVFIWDAESGVLQRRLTDSLRQVNAVAFHPNGSILATGESSGAAESTLKFWDASTGESLGNLPGETRHLVSLTFAPNGKFLAASCFVGIGGEVVVWNYETREEVFSFSVKDRTRSLAFSPDGSFLVFAAGRSEIQVWEMNEPKLLKSWIINNESATRLFGFLPDGATLLTSGGKRAIAKWNARTGEQISQSGGGVMLTTTSVGMSNDGRWLATSNGKWITILDAQSGLAPVVLRGHQTTGLQFSPKGDYLFSVGAEPFLVRWVTASPSLVGRGPTWEVSAGPLLATARDKPLCLLNVGSELGLWNYETRSPLMTLTSRSRVETQNSVAALSADGRSAAVFDERGRLHVWDVASNTCIFDTRIADAPGSLADAQLVFSVNSDILWIATASRLWRVNAKQGSSELWMDWPERAAITSFSPDGQTAATAAQGSQWQVWDLASRKPLFAANEHPARFTAYTFSRDSRHLVGLSERSEIFHWDLERRELLSRFELASGEPLSSSQIAFLPSQSHVLALSSSLLRVIDIERQKEVLRLHDSGQDEGASKSATTRNHESKTRLQITFDGHFAITGGKDSAHLAFWNLHLHQDLERDLLGVFKP